MPSTGSKRKINIKIRTQSPDVRGHRETDVGLEHELDFGEVSRRQYIGTKNKFQFKDLCREVW